MRIQHVSGQIAEPFGIVIADGGRGEMSPRFSAFVWGPVPDDAALETLSNLDQPTTLMAAV